MPLTLTLTLALSGAIAAPVLTLPRVTRAAIEYNTTSRVAAGRVNIHLQPHSHQDAGWLKTFDEYLVGKNASIQLASVQFILDSVVHSLARNPDRVFTVADIGFWQRWFEAAAPTVQELATTLVAGGQIIFVGGGWVMHDEATTTWLDCADQLSLGHRLLKKNFGASAAPRVGWQIDPFGHAAAEGSHFTAMNGQGAFFYGRSDVDEQALRVNTSTTEYVWRPSRSLGTRGQVLGGQNVHGYDPPTITGQPFSPINFDITFDTATRPAPLGPVQDNPDWDDMNVDAFVAVVIEMAGQLTNHILPASDGTVNIAWQTGTDFNYEQAELWYQSLDKLIHYVNLNTSTHGINLLYSSPTGYADAKLAQDTVWPLKTDDQMPLIGPERHWVWTGFFSSRPAFKGYVRSSSSLFAAARQMQAFTGGAPDDALLPSNPLFRLERALATAQHHDAVSGTQRQHVAYDYAKHLAAGRDDAGALVAAAVASLMGAAPTEETFVSCDLSNATICDALTHPTVGVTIALMVWNALSSSPPTTGVRVPIALPAGVASWRVTAPDGETALPAAILSASRRDLYLRETYYGAPQVAGTSWLAFQAPALPPLGFATFFLTPVAAAQDAPHTSASVAVGRSLRSSPRTDREMSNGLVTLTFDGSSGLVSHYADTVSGVSLPLAQFLGYYEASIGTNAPIDPTGRSSYAQPSTTYMFRPNSSTPIPISAVAELEVYPGTVVTEARQFLGGGDWGCVVLRLWAGASEVEVEFTIGPIPVGAIGKEVISRWSVGGGFGAGAPPTLWTDSNGLEMQRRVLNVRPSFNSTSYLWEPVSSNYYPIVVRAHIEDPATRVRLTLVTDRAVGCASLSTGSIESMIHRRLTVDAFLGNGEPLNEPGLDASGSGLPIRSTHWLHFDRIDGGGADAHGHTSALRAALYPPTTAFARITGSPASWVGTHKPTFSGSRAPLPLPAHVMTLQHLGSGGLLVRVQHVGSVGEEGVWGGKGSNVTISLRDDIIGGDSNLTVLTAIETVLSGTTPLSDVKPWTLRVVGEDPAGVTSPFIPPPPAGPSLDVTLHPQDVRTFILTLG